jgi:hypothetical protein
MGANGLDPVFRCIGKAANAIPHADSVTDWTERKYPGPGPGPGPGADVIKESNSSDYGLNEKNDCIT